MTKYRVVRWLAYILEILAVFVLQETPGLIPAVFGVRPVAVVPTVLAIAMFEDENPAMLFGLFGGLLFDFGFGSMLGFHGLILAVVCRAVSHVASDLFRTNFFTSLILNTSVCLVLTILQWACFYVLPGYQDAGYALAVHSLPIALYTVALTPITYYFNRALAMQIREKEE